MKQVIPALMQAIDVATKIATMISYVILFLLFYSRRQTPCDVLWFFKLLRTERSEGMVKDGEAASLLGVGFFEADRHRVDMS